MNKILVTIQGRTLILYYQVKQGPVVDGTMRGNYIQVLPSAELSRYNLKGLTPEMFCVNIADMVNLRGIYSGRVENEKQLPVAKWEVNYDEFLHFRNTVSAQLSHREIVQLLQNMPGYMGESEGQYIEFEERVTPAQADKSTRSSGYRLTVMTEDIECDIHTRAYYYLDTCTAGEWLNTPPLQTEYAAVRAALERKVQHIRDAGVSISAVQDETDYHAAVQ